MAHELIVSPADWRGPEISARSDWIHRLSAAELAEITLLAAEEIRRFGIEPRVALLSHSNFGSSDLPSALKMRAARELLRELDPPAAQSLSAALERCSGDVGLWVYYAKAPLIPYLRSAELRQLGCAIPLPAERLTRSENGQEIWGEAARRLAEITAFPHDVKARQAIEILLKQIGSEDFAMIRRSPPLLYHNDLSATVKRFYWSEEFGYALWLRLYQAARAESEQPR